MYVKFNIPKLWHLQNVFQVFGWTGSQKINQHCTIIGTSYHPCPSQSSSHAEQSSDENEDSPITPDREPQESHADIPMDIPDKEKVDII